MAKFDWKNDEVEEYTPLPAGAYVITITDVEAVPDKEYAWFMYDIAEGEYANQYEHATPGDDDWKHRFNRFWRDDLWKGNLGLLKLVKCLDASNPNFNWDGDTATIGQLRGYKVGVLFSTEKYTNNQGEDKERLVLDGIYNVEDVRNGKTRAPRVIDNREDADNDISNDDDLPFFV